MIISRTPYRVSFFGGGTDYHTWYEEHGGAVLSTTINHYIYLSVRHLPPFFNFKNRIVWRMIEETGTLEDIQHPAVRAVLEYMGSRHGIEMHYHGDLPAQAGLGSSSAFTVGLLNAMFALRGVMSSKLNLACEAVHIERDLLKENVGVQDQIAAAYGGFNRINILPNGEFSVHPVVLPRERIIDLQQNLLMFYTGVSRSASSIAAEQMKTAPSRKAELETMRLLVDDAVEVLNRGSLEDFGRLLHETWQLKKSLSSAIAPDFINDIYDRAMKAGALGGKLLGAGGGGFILFYVPFHKHASVLEALNELLLVPFEFENDGSRIIHYEPTRYSRTGILRRDFRHLQEEQEQADAEMEALLKNRKNTLKVA
jgi:D-glycero-alpha-D-manno-heptose-7-phosphate kinase